jgi:hypothetical protein
MTAALTETERQAMALAHRIDWWLTEHGVTLRAIDVVGLATYLLAGDRG